jgi:DNA topoisomerase-1
LTQPLLRVKAPGSFQYLIPDVNPKTNAVRKMSKNLIVVESPAKARTITKYLSGDFKALASYGHVRDLIPKTGAVDTEADFNAKYELIERNKQHVNAIAKAMKQADAIDLATDPDYVT